MVDAHANETLRWIPLLPLLAAAVSGLWLLFARHELPRAVVVGLGCAAPIASFALGFGALLDLTELEPGSRFFVDNVYTWISAYPFHAELGFLFDPLSSVMVLVVTGVGSLIHVYAVGYMNHDHRPDRGFQRFFVYLNLFTGSMLVLVLGDNLLVLFLGWEGVGLCSYLLIGFWYLDEHNAACGQKAFVVNRIGDFGFMLGILLLFWSFFDAGTPTIEFREMAANVAALAGRTVELPLWLAFLPGFPSWGLLTLAGLLLFLGAVGKSAQLPLHVWLPDAMAGPTPVSALIHAATMVTAGVYMVCRMSFVYELAPGALATVAWTGALTAFFGATIAMCQSDIKKILAYSTLSQLGFMFMAAGAAAYSAAIFHLVTHAFFKALLFLAAGSVILGMHHEQDTEHMGGLRRLMPVTFWTFLVGALALAGMPPFSGFFSKDEILLGTYTAQGLPGGRALFWIGVITAALTAFYAFRLQFRVFAGESRATPRVQAAVREPESWVMFPLVVLALLAGFGWLLGFPDAYGEALFSVTHSNSLHYFLEPVMPSVEHELGDATEFALAGAMGVLTGLGIGAAALMFWYRGAAVNDVRRVLRPLYVLVVHKYWVDELYDRAIVRPLVRFSDRVLYRELDVRLIDDLAVNGSARFVRALADRGLKLVQTGRVQSYLFVMALGCVALVALLMRGL